jgi:hypothetical protein
MILIGNFVNYNPSKMNSFLGKVLAGLILFFAPIQGLILSVGIAVVVDTFTGIYKTIKLKGWRSVRSRQLSNIISKMVLYETCVIALFPIDKFLLNELLFQLVSINYFATKIACVAIILVEITSIKENIEEALKIDIWKTMKNFIRRAKEVSNDYDEIKN